jgi:hypothetical protein
MHTVTVEIDVQEIRDQANKASTEFYSEIPKFNFASNGFRLEALLVNIPVDQTEEVNLLQQSRNELQERLRHSGNYEATATELQCRLDATLEQFKVYREKHPADPKDFREVAIPFLLLGQKINAIKAVREISGMGHKEAKDFCDALQAEIIPPAAA